MLLRRQELTHASSSLIVSNSGSWHATMSSRREESSWTPTNTTQTVPSPLLPRIVSGSVGSVLTSLVVTPLEVVKVRVQAKSLEQQLTTIQAPATAGVGRQVGPCPKGCGTFVFYNGQMECTLPKSAVSFFDASGKLTEKARQCFDWSNNNNDHTKKKRIPPLGTWGMVRRIFATEGLTGIYAGLTPTLVMAVPNTVLYYSSYDEMVGRLRRVSEESSSSSSSSWMIPFAAGGTARLVASSATAPLEYLRTLQASKVGCNLAAPGLWQELKTVIQTEGAGALYRGLRPTLWRDVPFSSIYWLVLETLKEKWRTRFGRPMSPTEQAGTSFMNGAVAGTVAAFCTTPFDVVKTKQQAQAWTAASSTAVGEACCHDGATVYELPHRTAGTFEYMAHIARSEGVPGLRRGNQARMLKVAPACAIMISTYEYGKRILS